ncbi:hypothetical protein FB451DRAFT_1188146 [Mycena latifolia]|nr:hypothetical protein FB451DRAFT_1188146 [Mycena latifolia]
MTINEGQTLSSDGSHTEYGDVRCLRLAEDGGLDRGHGTIRVGGAVPWVEWRWLLEAIEVTRRSAFIGCSESLVLPARFRPTVRLSAKPRQNLDGCIGFALTTYDNGPPLYTSLSVYYSFLRESAITALQLGSNIGVLVIAPGTVRMTSRATTKAHDCSEEAGSIDDQAELRETEAWLASDEATEWEAEFLVETPLDIAVKVLSTRHGPWERIGEVMENSQPRKSIRNVKMDVPDALPGLGILRLRWTIIEGCIPHVASHKWLDPGPFNIQRKSYCPFYLGELGKFQAAGYVTALQIPSVYELSYCSTTLHFIPLWKGTHNQI